jgi:hypothetical protein
VGDWTDDRAQDRAHPYTYYLADYHSQIRLIIWRFRVRKYGALFGAFAFVNLAYIISDFRVRKYSFKETS